MTRVGRRMRIGQVQAFAAGYAFYLTLALVPATVAALSLVGTGVNLTPLGELAVARFPSFVPPSAEALATGVEWTTAGGQLPARVVFLVALLVTGWCFLAAMRTLIKSVRLFFGETDHAGMVRVRLLATIGAIVTLLFGVGVIGTLTLGSPTFPWMPLDAETMGVLRWVRPPAIFLVMMLYCGTVYRLSLGSDRAAARVATVGALVASVLWVALALGLSAVLDELRHYGAFYVAVGGAVTLLVAYFGTAYCVLLGAVINAEFERVTMVDTSVDLPLDHTHSAVFPAAPDLSDGEPIPLRRRHG